LWKGSKASRCMSSNETPGIGGVTGIPTPKTRMTRAYGHFTHALSKTTPKNLRDARQARYRIKQRFFVPTRKGTRGR
jgi:hypothetical protein